MKNAILSIILAFGMIYPNILPPIHPPSPLDRGFCAEVEETFITRIIPPIPLVCTILEIIEHYQKDIMPHERPNI